MEDSACFAFQVSRRMHASDLLRAMAALLLLAPAACSNPDYSGAGVPFTCSDDGGVCPVGYQCSSGYCIPGDAEPLPTLLARSSALIRATSYTDAERGGTVNCWTLAESQGSAEASIDGAFANPDGSFTSVRFHTFDARGYDFRGACAPIPHSGGKILLAVWTQQSGVARIDLLIWTPTVPNGTSGSASLFYSEIGPGRAAFAPYPTVPMRLAVTGEEVWTIFQSPIAQLDTGFAHFEPILLMVSAADVEAGFPRRNGAIGARNAASTFQSFEDDVADVTLHEAPAGGAWMSDGRLKRYYTRITSGTAAQVPSVILYRPPEEGFGYILGTLDNRAAALYQDALESDVNGITYRVGWITPSVPRTQLTARMPFSRLETTYPGSMVVGEDLYLLAAHAPPDVPPLPLDGGADAGSLDAMAEAGLGGDSAGGTDAGPNTPGSHYVMTLYKMHFGDQDPTPFTVVHTYPRQLGDNQIVSASMAPFPDGRRFGVVWLELYPPDSAGRGLRYVQYAGTFDL